uniref:TRABID protein (C64 family) n=1 Tax=Schistosoma mansoni TaxID=6183 RepID=A0A5K4EE06_SCHMA
MRLLLSLLLLQAKMSHTLLQEWLDVVCTRRGLPLARLRLHSKHVLVDNMVEEWLDSYRSLAKLSTNSNPITSTAPSNINNINTTISSITGSTTIQHTHLVSEHSSSSNSISSDTDQVEYTSKSTSSSSDALRSSSP